MHFDLIPKMKTNKRKKEKLLQNIHDVLKLVACGSYKNYLVYRASCIKSELFMRLEELREKGTLRMHKKINCIRFLISANLAWVKAEFLNIKSIVFDFWSFNSCQNVEIFKTKALEQLFKSHGINNYSYTSLLIAQMLRRRFSESKILKMF